MIKRFQLIDKSINYDDVAELESRAKLLRKVYLDYINSLEDEIKHIKLKDFENPNWAFERAFKDGMLNAFNKIKNLIGD